MANSRVILATGEEVLAPDNEVLEGIKQGKWKLPEVDLDGNEMTFSVRDTEGAFEVPASYLNNEINEAFESGLSLNTLEQAKQDENARRQEIIKDSFDMPGTATAAGVLRGATLGLSDVAIEQLAGKEALKNLKEENPNASLVGDVVGSVAPAILSGGSSLAARGAQKTAAGAISKFAADQGAKATAKIAAKTGLKEGLKKRALEAGIGSGIEGALYSGGRSLVDEALLGDEEANYGKVVQDLLTGGLVEGALGAGLGAGIFGGGKLISSGLTKGTELVKQPKLWNSVGKLYGKAVEKTKGSDAVSRVFNEKVYNQEQVARYLDDITQADADLATEYSKMVNQAEDVQRQAARLREEGLADVSLDKAVEDIPEESLTKLDSALNKYNAALEEVSTSPKAYEDGLGRRLEGLKDVMKPDNIFTLRDVATNFRNTKRTIDEIMGGYRAKTKRGERLNFREQESFNLLNDLRKDIDSTIKDYKLFGEAGKKFKESDKLYAATIEPLNTIKKIGNVDTFRELTDNADELVGLAASKEFDPAMVARLMRKTSTGKQKVKLENAQKAINESFTKLGKEVESLTDLDLGHVERIGKVNEMLDLAKDIQSIERTTGRNLEGMLIGGGVSGLVGVAAGVPGYLAGQAVGNLVGSALSNPVTLTKMLINMEKNIQKFDKSVKEFKDIYGGGLKKLKPERALIGVHPILKSMTESNSDVETVEKFQTGEAFEKMRNRTKVLESVAPNYARTINRQINVAEGIVQEVLPTVKEPTKIGETESKLIMSPAQSQTLNQVMLASFAPNEFMKVIKSGKATKKGMQALQQAHPKIYEQLTEAAIEAVISGTASRQDKLKLQYMFNLPITSDMKNIGMRQQLLYGEQPQATGEVQQRETTKLRAKGLDNMTFAEETAATSSQF